MIDPDGFRPNVGIILCNQQRQVFWGRRVGQRSWQFPQGGIADGEAPVDALYRELTEETGLAREDVRVLGATRGWLHYHLPKRFIRKHASPRCIGQKQVWFLLELLGDERRVRLDAHARPEFDAWRWVSYWQPLQDVIFFKRHVYLQALVELEPLIFPPATPRPPAVEARLARSRAGASARPRRRARSA